MEISSATEVDIINGKEFVLSISGGTMTVERQLADDSWVELADSPVADGADVRLLTQSKNKTIRLTPTSGTVDYEICPISYDMQSLGYDLD